MHLTKVRAGRFGVLLAMTLVGLVTLPTPKTIAQTLVSPYEDGLSKAPEGPPRPAPKLSLAFRAAELYFAGDTVFDMTTTAMSLDHPTTALRSDGSFLTQYFVVEKGWAGIFGRRDPYTAVAANVILNYGVDRYSRRLYARGGRWRAISYGAIVLKGTLNSLAARSNIQSDERIDERVRLATGYKGLILWSK